MGLPLVLAVLATALALDPQALDPTAPKLATLALALAVVQGLALLDQSRTRHRAGPEDGLELPPTELAILLYPAFQAIGALFVRSAWESLAVALRGTLAAQMLLLTRVAARHRAAKTQDTWTATVAAGASALAFLGLAGAWWGFSKPLGDAYTSSSEMVGTLGNPAMLGAWMGACVPLLLSRPDRSASVLALPPVIAALVLSYSRAAWVAVALVVGLLGPWPRGRQWASIGLGFGLAMALAPLFPAAAKLASAHTSAQRWLVWRAALAMVASHPLCGVGPGQFPSSWPWARPADYGRSGLLPVMTHAHCVPLHALAEGGILGIALLALALAPTVRRLAAALAGGTRREPSAGRAHASALLVLAVHSLASPSTESVSLMALAAWLAGRVEPATEEGPSGRARRRAPAGPARGEPSAGPECFIRKCNLSSLALVGLIVLDLAVLPPLIRAELAQRAAGAGERLRLAGRLDEAADRFRAAAALDPADPVMTFMVGAAGAQRDPCAAMASLVTAEAAWGDQGDIHYDRAIVALLAGDRAGAIRQAQSHLSRDAASVQGLVLAGRLAYEDADYARARACLEDALASCPAGSDRARELRDMLARLDAPPKGTGAPGR